MKLLQTRVEERAEHVRLVGVVERAHMPESFEVFFEFPSEFRSFVLRDVADPFVPVLLLPSMLAGEDLEIVPRVSARLLGRLARAQDIMVSWWRPHFRRIRVEARAEKGSVGEKATATGALFSGGVDSFYTLIKSLRADPASDTRPITHLLFFRGLETPLEKAKGSLESQRQAEDVARATGTRLLCCETNVRTHFCPDKGAFQPGVLDYEHHYHGAALLSAALALSCGLGTVLVPSSFSYAQQTPWGSAPLLDELWSTERLEVVHDGSECRRSGKLSTLVAHDPLAQQYLRVCIRNEGGPYNCGRCKKCVRTMLMLELIGVLPKFRTFSHALPTDLGEVLARTGEDWLEELRDLAIETGRRPDIERLITRTLRRLRRRRGMALIARNVAGLDRLLGMTRPHPERP
jgi:hypothetical protein